MALRQIEILLNGITDTNGDPVSAGNVYVYVAGTTTEAVIYQDKNGLTPNTNPIVLDANGIAQVYGDGVYKFVVKDSDDVTLNTYDNIYVGVTDSQINYSGTSTGSANAYILTNDVPSTAYTALDTYRFIANFANTDVATVNIDGLGAKTIKQYDGTALESGDIAINSFNEIVYNGTDFLLATNGTALSGSIAGLQTTLTTAIQNSSYTNGGDSTGSANVHAITLTPAPASLVDGMTIKFAAGYTNTSTATLNVNSLGAKALLDNRTSAALKPSDIEALKLYTVVYDSFLNSFLVLDCSRSANQSFYKSGASVINTTSTSITTMTSMSQAVTVKVGDIVMVTGDASMSHSAIYGQAKLAILKDSVAVSPEMTVREHDDTSTAGRSISQSVNYCETIATAGTYTYALGWETNAGTLYSEQRCMSIIVLARN